ncbi:Leucine Rich repeats (2 copies) [compost metagenome]
MQALTSLDLSGTGLGELPRTLIDNRRLIHVDLSNNAIREVPTELSQADAMTTVAFNLGANPLSTASLERIAEHFHRTGNTLGVGPGNAI